MDEERSEFIYGAGCKACVYTGYLGRTGIFEIMTITDDIRQMVINKVPAAQITRQALKDGMVNIAHDGMLKVKSGLTTPYEIMRNIELTK
jgi:type II secretory ATPase GspE/PulE/Tfp pilus assembly ATPase PilB-like protein